MVRVLLRLAPAAPLLLAALACDDYEEYPPVTPASVQAEPAPVQQDTYADADPSALSDFHGTLDAHGAWVDDPTYGTVWVPNANEVGADFAPYETAGHWAYDDADYVWVSDYDWGWAPFHYGRWVYGGSGWVWIPGRAYAPAWVDWRLGANDYPYVGWGPMYPSFIWRGGVAVGYVPVGGPGRYYYCPRGEIFAPRIAASVIVGPQVSVIAGHTAFYGGGVVGARVGIGVAHGPPPASLGIAPQNVAHVSANDRGPATARNFAHPSTATKMGARAPAGQAAARPSGAVHGGGGFRGGGSRGGGHGGGHGGHR